MPLPSPCAKTVTGSPTPVTSRSRRTPCGVATSSVSGSGSAGRPVRWAPGPGPQVRGPPSGGGGQRKSLTRSPCRRQVRRLTGRRAGRPSRPRCDQPEDAQRAEGAGSAPADRQMAISPFGRVPIAGGAGALVHTGRRPGGSAQTSRSVDRDDGERRSARRWPCANMPTAGIVRQTLPGRRVTWRRAVRFGSSAAWLTGSRPAGGCVCGGGLHDLATSAGVGYLGCHRGDRAGTVASWWPRCRRSPCRRLQHAGADHALALAISAPYAARACLAACTSQHDGGVGGGRRGRSRSRSAGRPSRAGRRSGSRHAASRWPFAQLG
jgi:hypothetical protein